MDDIDTNRSLILDMSREVAVRLVAATADVAMVMDDGGVVEDISFGGDRQLEAECAGWRGKSWLDTIAADSRAKACALLADAESGSLRQREINHAIAAGESVPIRYAAIKDRRADRVIVVGRDLRALAGLEQRLALAQQTMERDYARLRASETRYRILFHLTAEPVLIVDAASRRIIEANAAAAAVLDAGAKLTGRTLAQVLPLEEPARLQAAFARATASGENALPVALPGRSEPVEMRLTAFRQEGAALMLIRLAAESAPAPTHGVGPTAAAILEALPEAFVATDPEGRILSANAAFLDLIQVASAEQLTGQPIDRYLLRGAADFTALTDLLAADGTVRGFTAVVTGPFGASEDVEITAVTVTGEMPCYGFVLRGRARPRALEARMRADMARSVDEMTELVGRVPLKELVRETTDIIERLCIETALHMTGDNRASAAELLGLSRQSLYAKLHRFGIADIGGDGAA